MFKSRRGQTLPKLLARSVPNNVTVPVYFAVNKPVPWPACLHTNAVSTATQKNHISSVFSGIPATADGVMSVLKMPQPSVHFYTQTQPAKVQVSHK